MERTTYATNKRRSIDRNTQTSLREYVKKRGGVAPFPDPQIAHVYDLPSAHSYFNQVRRAKRAAAEKQTIETKDASTQTEARLNPEVPEFIPKVQLIRPDNAPGGNIPTTLERVWSTTVIADSPINSEEEEEELQYDIRPRLRVRNPFSTCTYSLTLKKVEPTQPDSDDDEESAIKHQYRRSTHRSITPQSLSTTTSLEDLVNSVTDPTHSEKPATKPATIYAAESTKDTSVTAIPAQVNASPSNSNNTPTSSPPETSIRVPAYPTAPFLPQHPRNPFLFNPFLPPPFFNVMQPFHPVYPTLSYLPGCNL